MSGQEYRQIFCKHCKQEIRVGHMTMNGPEDYVHDPGGYGLCIIDRARPGTHAEPAPDADMTPGDTVDIGRRPGDPGTGLLEGVITWVWDNGEYVTVLVNGKGVYVRHIDDVDLRERGSDHG